MSQAQVRERMVDVGGCRLHVLEAGPEGGRPVILLHGFPEYSWAWRAQLEGLAARGWRVIAPDQRGYHLSDAPQGVGAYRIERLGQDVVGLMDALGIETAAVVGHDWGGGVAWRLGAAHPERLERLIILNCPHLSVMARAVWGPRQLLRSAYMLLFQVPRVAEWVCRREGFWFLRQALLTAKEGTFSDEALRAYVEVWGREGRLTGMLSWYRAALRGVLRLKSTGRVEVPTLVIWGDQDAFLGLPLAAPSVEMCDDGQLVVLEGATHWLQHEAPERVNALIDQFLRGEMVES